MPPHDAFAMRRSEFWQAAEVAAEAETATAARRQELPSRRIIRFIVF